MKSEGISSRDLILILLGIDRQGLSSTGIGGITRLQKLLFLLQEEKHLEPSGKGFDFIPYKAGPFSRTLYDDLEFLENLGFIESKASSEASIEESSEIDLLEFDDLINDEEKNEPFVGPADAYEERKYTLTAAGLGKVQKLINSGKFSEVIESVKTIKAKYGPYSLSDLLYYIYTKYPEMATESEIREGVIRRRGRN